MNREKPRESKDEVNIDRNINEREIPDEKKPEAIEMSEDFIEPKGKSSKWGEVVENKELGVSYREKIIELPKNKQKEIGIKQIRRKEVISILNGKTPEEILRIFEGGEIDYKERKKTRDELKKIMYFLTEGSFPSYRTWNHAMFADSRTDRLRRFKKEGLYFQKIIPIERMKEKINTFGERKSPFFKRGEQKDLEIDNNYPKYDDSALMCYDLSVSEGEDIWSATSGPIFVFGNKNRAFVKYIEQITSNPETQQMMKLMGWNIDKPIKFAEIGAPKESFDWGNQDRVLLTPKIDYLPYPPGVDGDGSSVEFRYDIWTDQFAEQVGSIHKENKRLDIEAAKSKTVLENLVNGIPQKIDWPHPLLPIVQHPDIKPLRWCHSDIGLITTNNSINVLFFETGYEDKKEE